MTVVLAASVCNYGCVRQFNNTRRAYRADCCFDLTVRGLLGEGTRDGSRACIYGLGVFAGRYLLCLCRFGREHTATRRVLEKLGMAQRGEVDLYDSVAQGLGLLPLYTVSRAMYLQRRRERDRS